MLKFHKESDFHLPQSQNCLLGHKLRGMSGGRPLRHQIKKILYLIHFFHDVLNIHFLVACQPTTPMGAGIFDNPGCFGEKLNSLFTFTEIIRVLPSHLTRICSDLFGFIRDLMQI